MYPAEKTAINVPINVTATSMTADSVSAWSENATLKSPAANQVKPVAGKNGAEPEVPMSATSRINEKTHVAADPITVGRWLRCLSTFGPSNAVMIAASNGQPGISQRTVWGLNIALLPVARRSSARRGQFRQLFLRLG